MNIQTNDIKQIESILNKADTNTLVIFDVDEVLFHPKDQILKSKYRQLSKEYEKSLGEVLPIDQLNDYISIIWREHNSELVNAKMPNLIINLQNNNIKALALTACMAGKFGKIDSMEDWRYNDLRNLNYNFEFSWQNLESNILNQLQIDEFGFYPTYHKGVNYAGFTSKGKVLEAFLEYANYSPKKIIFLDDLMVNIESVETLTQKLNIEYIGINYTASIDSTSDYIDHEIVKLQFDILLKEKKWLSDENVKKMF